MKKALCLLLVVVLFIACFGCAKKTSEATNTTVAAPDIKTDTVADAYPTKPIKLIVNFSAGGVTDLAARALAAEMEKTLGQTIVVENHVGGDGANGMLEVANAAPDGYTIGTSTASPHAILPHLQDTGFNLDSFTYIGFFGGYKHGLAVTSSSPVTDLKSFVAATKEKPLNVAFSGYVNALALKKLCDQENVKVNLVPYPSGKEASAACAGGHVDAVACTEADLVPVAQSGNIRIVAPFSETRWTSMPDVPTSVEQGYNILSTGGMGIVAPKGLPENVYKALCDAFDKAVASESYVTKLTEMGSAPVFFNSKDFYDEMVRESETGKALLIDLGLISK